MSFLFADFSYILIAAAVIPAVILLLKVYRADRMEPEPIDLIIQLVALGAASTLIAIALESFGCSVIDNLSSRGHFASDNAYYRAEFFLIVGPAEELSKYILLKLRSWKDRNFNCQFDAIVYSVCVSLGFAILENIKYVFSYGMITALVRAVTAIPGHACFGVFMGVFYGAAKRLDLRNQKTASLILRIISIVIPAIIHGFYDYIATISSGSGTLVFIAFIAALFWICLRLVKKMAAVDRYID